LTLTLSGNLKVSLNTAPGKPLFLTCELLKSPVALPLNDSQRQIWLKLKKFAG